MPATAKLKSSLRRVMRAALKAREPSQSEKDSLLIRQHLSHWLSGRHLSPAAAAIFSALPDEPDLLPVLESAPEIEWCLPRVDGSELRLHSVSGSGDLLSGAFGILEPDPRSCPELVIGDIDLFLVPGLAFDPENGSRLGRGKGYYDRLLSSSRHDAIRVGVAFDCQLATVPAERHDVPMHAILTESGWKPVPFRA